MKRDPTAARLLDAEGAAEPSTRHDLARGRHEGQVTQSSAEYATAALLPSGSPSTASRLPASSLLIPLHGRAAMFTHGVARQGVMLMTNAAIAGIGDGMRHGATRPVSRPISSGRDAASGGDDGRHAGQDKQGQSARSPAARRNPVQRRVSRIQGRLTSARQPPKRRGAGRGAASLRCIAAWASRNISAVAVRGQRPRAVPTTGRHRVRYRTPAVHDPSRPVALATWP
jgi:hypothetical protein